MAFSILYCKVPTGLISCLAVLSNITMIVFLQCTTRLKGPMKTWVTNLGCINVLFSCTICMRSFISIFSTKQSTFSHTTQAIIMAMGCFLTILQLASQVSISLERFIVVRFPIEYRSRYSRSGRKRFVAAVWTASAIFGTVIGGSSVHFNRPLLISISTWVAFGGAFVMQILSYVFIIKELKANARQVRQMLSGDKEAPSRSTTIEQARRKRERQLHILATGITLSYICCNLPIMVFVGFYQIKMESQTCYTREGLFYTLSLAFVCLNMLIDPLWYFFNSYWLSQKRTDSVI